GKHRFTAVQRRKKMRRRWRRIYKNRLILPRESAFTFCFYTGVCHLIKNILQPVRRCGGSGLPEPIAALSL
ncbi:hypothetical protein POG20_17910, partial [Blautia wexlerae]|nr:hypothetical protein [Blautia wexlerae]